MTDIDQTVSEAKAAVLPFESWERLAGETGGAYAAFCAYRDYGPERNIRKALEAAGNKGKAGRAGGESGTGCGGPGRRNSGGGSGRRVMTNTLTG
jgi:hypothetical protein